jgi:hypothetical protein
VQNYPERNKARADGRRRNRIATAAGGGGAGEAIFVEG